MTQSETMKPFIWLLRLFILLLLVWFAVKNSGMVTLYAYPFSWQAPLILVILVFFAVGVILGVIASFGSMVRLKREAGALKKEIREHERTAADNARAAQTVRSSPGPDPHGV